MTELDALLAHPGWVLLLGLFPLIGRGCCSGIAVNKDSEDPLLDSDEEDLLSAHNSPRGPDATGDPTFAWAHRAELSPAADDQSAGDGVPLIHDRASCKEQS